MLGVGLGPTGALVGVAVRVRTGVAVVLGRGVLVEVLVGCGVAVRVAVAVAVAVGTIVGVNVAVGSSVGVGCGVGVASIEHAPSIIANPIETINKQVNLRRSALICVLSNIFFIIKISARSEPRG
jgi:hypothetical protein